MTKTSPTQINYKTKINPTRTTATIKPKKYKSHPCFSSNRGSPTLAKLNWEVRLGAGGRREGAEEQRHKMLKLEGPRVTVTGGTFQCSDSEV